MPSAERPDWALVTNYVPRRPWLHSRAYLMKGGRGTSDPTRKDNMAKPTTDAIALLAGELARKGIIAPADLLEGVSPGAALLYLHDLAEAVTGICAWDAAKIDEEDPEAAAIFSGVANGLGHVMVGVTHAMVELRLLPTEAEEAMLEVGKPDGS